MFKPTLLGKRRRYVVAGVAFLTVTLSAALPLAVDQHDLWVALAVLLIALIGFHSVALLSFECTSCWRAVDYPWVLATFMAILIALTNIYENSRIAPLATAQIERRLNYEQLIYAMKGVITNDCHPKPSRTGIWNVSPEPHPGACDRIEHFLPQIENEAARDALTPDDGSGNAWGLDILAAEENAVGSWAGLYAVARKFHATSKRTREVIEGVRQTPRSPIAAWATSSSLKYWYFILAFCLGLRLSKITAELLAGHAVKRPSGSGVQEQGPPPRKTSAPAQLVAPLPSGKSDARADESAKRPGIPPQPAATGREKGH